MIINRISANYGQNYYSKSSAQRNFVSPSFQGYVMPRLAAKNANGAKILERAIKLIKIIPEQSKMVKPSVISIIEDGINKTYGIYVDRSKFPNISEVIIRDLTEYKSWNSKMLTKDKATLYIDDLTGQMTSGYHNGMQYSYANGRSIKYKNEVRFPVCAGANNWSGPQDMPYNDKDPLNSIFWTMMYDDVSIKH